MEAEIGFERALKPNAARFRQRFKSVFQHMDWREYALPPLLGPVTVVVVVVVVVPVLNSCST
jgi:hypothetical protein